MALKIFTTLIKVVLITENPEMKLRKYSINPSLLLLLFRKIVALRTVPAFATAHMFCISGDTLCFLWAVRYTTGIFLLGLKLSEESRPPQLFLVSKMKIVGNDKFFT